MLCLGEGGDPRALRPSGSLSLQSRALVLSGKGWAARVLSRLLAPGFTIVNRFQIVLLYRDFSLMEALSEMQIVMIINEGNL